MVTHNYNVHVVYTGKPHGKATCTVFPYKKGLPAVGKCLKGTQHVPSCSFTCVTLIGSKLTRILSLPHYSNKCCFTISLVAFKF